MKRFIDYTEYSSILNNLCVKLLTIKHDFTHVYGPPRGGLPIAVHMSHQCNIPLVTDLDIFDNLINNEYYNIRSHLLICDDVCDSGETIYELCDKYKHYLPKSANLMDITVLTLFSKPRMNRRITDTILEKINFISCEEVSNDTWLIFPWETLESEADKEYMK